MNTIICILLSTLLISTHAQTFDTASVTANDILVLNYALFLERLEATFYARFQGIYSNAAFTAAGISTNVRDHLQTIASHEAAHVTFLQGALGSHAAAACTSYNFSLVTDVKSYIQTAKVLESVGVAAYDGAVNLITNRQIALAAATIATVEGRHASYLYNLTTGIPSLPGPFPDAFENTLSPLETIFIVLDTFDPQGCVPPTLPETITVVPSQATLLFTNGTFITPNQGILDANDIRVLQYALILEHLEANFYATYASKIQGYPNPTVSSFFGLIAEHEATHVDALTNALSNLGANPVGACPGYNFSVFAGDIGTNYTRFITVSSILENTGVGAYDNALASITDKDYQMAAATIATVEARHAAFVNDLLSPNSASAPFPGQLDTPFTVATVVKAILPIITINGVVCGNANLAPYLPAEFLNLLPRDNTTATSVAATASTSGVASLSSSTASSSSTGASTAASTAASSSTGSASSAASSAAASSTATASTSTGTSKSAASTVVFTFFFAFAAFFALLF